MKEYIVVRRRTTVEEIETLIEANTVEEAKEISSDVLSGEVVSAQTISVRNQYVGIKPSYFENNKLKTCLQKLELKLISDYDLFEEPIVETSYYDDNFFYINVTMCRNGTLSPSRVERWKINRKTWEFEEP